MASQYDACMRWVRNVTAVPGDRRANLKASNIFANGDTIYSYGYHFAMAQLIRGDDRFFLVNGDRFSNSTSRHQSHVRSAIAHSSLPSIIIPFTALDAAGIVRDTVRIVDTLPDRMLPVTRTVKKLDDYSWFQEECLGRWKRRYMWSAVEGESVYATENDDGTFTYIGAEHRLGESLFTADTYSRGAGTRNAMFLSGFDHQERVPCYFLSELATMTPTTVAEAYESLKPDTVALAEAMGKAVRRQGDIFAVPTELTTRQLTKLGAVRTKRGNLLTTNHTASEVAILPSGQTLARGVLRHEPQWRAPDHVRQCLPKGVWHIILKNTVPLST